jgi:hypothetical protein
MMGDIMALNIIKGVGALFLVFVICFVATSALSVANGTPRQPNFALAFAWIGTSGAMFYAATGFWRRLFASLLGSIASLVVPFGFGFLNALLLQNGMYEYLLPVVLGLGVYLAILNIAQLATAFVVARAVVKRGMAAPKLAVA